MPARASPINIPTWARTRNLLFRKETFCPLNYGNLSRLDGIQTHALCNANATLSLLSYQPIQWTVWGSNPSQIACKAFSPSGNMTAHFHSRRGRCCPGCFFRVKENVCCWLTRLFLGNKIGVRHSLICIECNPTIHLPKAVPLGFEPRKTFRVRAGRSTN